MRVEPLWALSSATGPSPHTQGKSSAARSRHRTPPEDHRRGEARDPRMRHTAKLRSPVWLFLAERLMFTEATPEGTEAIRPVKLPFREAVRQVLESSITHAPSCVLILKAQLVRATPT
jgi:hypothetical protein